MAQDPDRYESQRNSDVLRNTHALDMVDLASGSVSTPSEANMIRGVLDANGIPSLLVAGAEFPNFGFQVKVPRGKLKEKEGAGGARGRGAGGGRRDDTAGRE